jgi:AcrR family transcriptional regulator
MTTSMPPNIPAKSKRSDGLESRNRLLDVALSLFASKGFANTSTREIAQSAHANIASISYYFGDKVGLYRAVFEDPRYTLQFDPARAAQSDSQGIRGTIECMLRGIVEPLKSSEQVRQCMMLHFREMVDPTGMWQGEIDNNIKPAHEALTQALALHLNVSQTDDDVHRLAFQIEGLGIMLHVGLTVVQSIRPALIATSVALETYHARLVDSSMALVEAEATRRVQMKKSKSQPRLKGKATL